MVTIVAMVMVQLETLALQVQVPHPSKKLESDSLVEKKTISWRPNRFGPTVCT